MLGVCYYPEHWPQEKWEDDARQMAALGLHYVRIGEFAWSRYEPRPGEYDFAWFDKAIDILHAAGLKVVIGTPTATPPKWLIDAHPEILPVDPHTGQVRGFGSRRHYDFSSEVYLHHALRITEVMAKRYGPHPGVVGWQTDNEISCHDTTLSGSEAAKHGFQKWLKARYGTIEALNTAWGNVFWSMEYQDFDAIELPILAVTETSPAHRLAWRRYSSDMVIRFHNEMAKVIRAHAPGHFITHNFIPMNETGVDNFALAEPLDFASYDNYPLGRTDLAFAHKGADEFRRYMRTGHPDFGAWYFDQTQGLAKGDFWVMEQQPGPVNWAHHNPRPLPGMVRLWSLEAFAHGAAVVSYFRWRQAPFAQEQMHAGLLRSDSSKAEAWAEVEQVRRDIETLGLDQIKPQAATVAIISDAETQWVGEIERQGDSYDFPRIQFQWYSALRRLGVDVDVVSDKADLSAYRLILIPSRAIIDDVFVDKLAALKVPVVFGPRSGAKTAEFTLPDTLPPGALQRLLPIRVETVETLRPDCFESISFEGETYKSISWREGIAAGPTQVLAEFDDGGPALLRHKHVLYLASLVDDAFLETLFAKLCGEAGVDFIDLPPDMRLRKRGALTFAFNYRDIAQEAPAPDNARFLLGERLVAPRSVSVWTE